MSAFLSLRNAPINLPIESPILQPYIITLVIPVSHVARSQSRVVSPQKPLIHFGTNVSIIHFSLSVSVIHFFRLYNFTSSLTFSSFFSFFLFISFHTSNNSSISCFLFLFLLLFCFLSFALYLYSLIRSIHIFRIELSLLDWFISFVSNYFY